MFFQNPLVNFGLAFLTALAVSAMSIPQIIYVAKRKRLFDVPDNHRKLHKRIVPNLGGIGIFMAFVLAGSLFVTPEQSTTWTYIVAATLLLFIIGVKDDLIAVSPTKKFVTQAVSSFIIVVIAGIRIKSFHGLFGLDQLPYWFSVAFTMVGCMFVTNAFNLIDGIDGLAGSIGLMGSLLFGVMLATNGHQSEAVIAFCMAGALCGFLRYNISPAKIFMGDTGSLVIGFTMCVLGILFLNAEHGASNAVRIGHHPTSALALALAVLFIPIFDTFRVFATRIAKGHGPFRADRTHLHHYLLDLGLNHTQAVGAIVSANLLIVLACALLHGLNIHVVLMIQFCLALVMYTAVFALRRSRAAHAAVHHAVAHNAGLAEYINEGDDGTNNTKQGRLAPTLPGAAFTVNGHKIRFDEPVQEPASIS